VKKKLICWIVLLFCFSPALSCQKSKWIRIGIVEDQSGVLRSVYESQSNGRNLAIQAINAKASSTWKIRLLTADSLNIPEKTANLMRDMSDQVDAFMGINSIECAQVAKYIAHYRQKTLITDTFDESVTDQVETTLLFQQSPLNMGKLAVRYFYSNLKKDRLVILYDESNRSYKSIAKGFSSEGELIGAQVISESFDSTVGKIDFNRILARIQSLNPQVIYFCTNASDHEELLKLSQLTFNMHSILFLNRIPDEIMMSSNPKIFQQIFCIVPFFDQKETFVNSKFFAEYKQKFNKNPDYYSLMGYDEMILLQEMMATKTNQSILDLFTHLKGSSMDPLRFMAGFRGFSADGLAKRPIDIVRISEGKMQLVTEFWTEVSLRR